MVAEKDHQNLFENLRDPEPGEIEVVNETLIRKLQAELTSYPELQELIIEELDGAGFAGDTREMAEEFLLEIIALMIQICGECQEISLQPFKQVVMVDPVDAEVFVQDLNNEQKLKGLKKLIEKGIRALTQLAKVHPENLEIVEGTIEETVREYVLDILANFIPTIEATLSNDATGLPTYEVEEPTPPPNHPLILPISGGTRSDATSRKTMYYPPSIRVPAFEELAPPGEIIQMSEGEPVNAIMDEDAPIQ